jgi:hypothetical protein
VITAGPLTVNARSMMKILGVDPGTTTGVAVWTDEEGDGGADSVLLMADLTGQWEDTDDRDWRARELNIAEDVFSIALEGEVDVVVIEDFVLRPGGTGVRAGLSPVRIGAAISAFLRVENAVRVTENKSVMLVVWQTPAMAKQHMTDTRLKANGLWVRGSAHQRDALRHAITGYKRLSSGSRIG